MSGEPAGDRAQAGPPAQGQEPAPAPGGQRRRRSGTPGAWDSRFPGFDAAAQVRHWDPVTAGVVLSRLRIPQELGFFTPVEEAAATALCDLLLGQAGQGARRIPVVVLIDARLARMETDGWTGDGPIRRHRSERNRRNDCDLRPPIANREGRRVCGARAQAIAHDHAHARS